jgi:hypothetical protein
VRSTQTLHQREPGQPEWGATVRTDAGPSRRLPASLKPEYGSNKNHFVWARVFGEACIRKSSLRSSGDAGQRPRRIRAAVRLQRNRTQVVGPCADRQGDGRCSPQHGRGPPGVDSVQTDADGRANARPLCEDDRRVRSQLQSRVNNAGSFEPSQETRLT